MSSFENLVCVQQKLYDIFVISIIAQVFSM